MCLEYDYGESLKSPNSFYFHEQYTGKEEFDAHAISSHFLKWEEFASKNPFMKPPFVKFYHNRLNEL
jgi:quinol monooxygenase YgiN